MFCKMLLGQAVPVWGRTRAAQRIVSVSIQTPSKHELSPTKPDYRPAAQSPRGYSSGSASEQGTTDQQQQQRSGASDRVYTSFTIYKSRSAMAVRLLPPVLAANENGYKTIDRDGAMLLEFANANAGGPSGAGGPPPAGGINRTYNWGSKVVFALSPVEIGEILAGDKIASSGVTLFHDPTKLGKSGEPLKRLSLKQMPDGAVNFSLTAGPDAISIPVSRAEFEVLKSVGRFAIPRLLGFDVAFGS